MNQGCDSQVVLSEGMKYRLILKRPSASSVCVQWELLTTERPESSADFERECVEVEPREDACGRARENFVEDS